MEVLGTARASPREARERLVAALPEVRSVWLPTTADLRRWDLSTARLYVRWAPDGGLEVGPRLYSVAAARWAPVWRGRIEPSATGSHFVGSVRSQPLALALLVGWAAVLAVWALVELRTGADLRWVPWWGVLAAFTTLGAALSRVGGGRALAAALPELLRLADDAGAGGDDWG